MSPRCARVSGNSAGNKDQLKRWHERRCFKPKATKARLKAMNPVRRFVEMRALTKRAGANTSYKRKTYSSMECAACAITSARKAMRPTQ